MPTRQPIDEAVLTAYDALVATRPNVERKGATMPYTSMNGNMFSFLTPDGTLALRLSASDRDAFMAQYGSTLVEQHGAVMKEYVAVPADLLARIDEVKPWFDRSCDYAGSLKPKRTTRSTA
jgi:TfoX/Sxy family transcriptional regulator of competence genes